MKRKSIGLILAFFIVLILVGIVYNRKMQETEDSVIDNLTVFMPGQEISALFYDGAKLWVGTPEGIYLLDPESGEMLKKLEAHIEMIYAAAFAQTPDGIIWAGHDKGVCAFDPEGNELFRMEEPQIPGGRVNALRVTEEGLYAGMQEGAVLLTKEGDNWSVKETFTTDNGLIEEVVQVIMPVGEEMWFGSYLAADQGGISIRRQDGWCYLSTKDGIQHRYINAILPLSDDRVLIGSGQMVYGGLSLAEKKEDHWEITHTWDAENGIPGMKVRYLFQDSSGRLWITTESDGVMVLNTPDRLFSMTDGKISGTVIKQENGLADNEVKCMEESASCIWLGGKYGLTRYEK